MTRTPINDRQGRCEEPAEDDAIVQLKRILAFADEPCETPKGPINAGDLARLMNARLGVALLGEFPRIREIVARAQSGVAS